MMNEGQNILVSSRQYQEIPDITPLPYPGKDVHVKLTPELHRKIKAQCAYKDITLKSYFEKLIEDSL